MANVLFTNVRIIDATGAQPYPGEVLIQGNRIARVGRGSRSLPTTGVTVIDGAGATLMPGMCEAHTHFGWTNSKTLDAIQKMPHEEHTLWAAQVAKLYLDHGWTSCVGAATPKPRLDCVIRDAINSGQIPGPRYLAASQEITVTGSLGDDMLPHLPFPEMSFGCVVDGPDGMRKAVRMFLKYGVDQVKLNLSGDNLVPGADARTSWMSDEEVAVAAHEVKVRGKRLASHARSSESVKQSMRHGVEVIYHASFADEEALDMLEAQKDKIFVAPGLSVIIRLLYEGEVVGITNDIAKRMGYELELEAAVQEHEGDAQARHPRAARRRLRLRLGAARRERQGPRVLRQVPQHDADGGPHLGDALGRADHDAARTSARSARAGSPTCCWSTATRSPTSRSCRTSPSCSRS